MASPESFVEPDALKCTPKRKVLGDIGNDDSPVSPMANLRLLIKVATSPKVYTDSLSDSLSSEETHPVKKGFAAGYVRKNKSLGILCEKFLMMFPLEICKGQSMIVSLNYVARELGVEKRRIYDIINVLECLAMAKKVSKDTYTWFGNQNLAKTMGLFLEYASQIGLHEIMKKAQEGQRLNMEAHKDLFDEPSISSVTSVTRCLLDKRRLGVLCQKFIMLLVSSHQRNSLVGLNAAVSLLVAESEHAKTRHRRLYDIANILQSLKIIRRVFPNDSAKSDALIFKKPVYFYSGPKIEKASLSLNCRNENCITIANHSDHTSLVKTELDASDSSTNISKDMSPEKPAAKKRLVFKPETQNNPSNNIIHKSFDLFCRPNRKQPLKSTAKLEPGACYKAVQLGSSIHLVKLQ